MYSIGSLWMWLSFFIFIFIVLAIDIFFLGGKKASKVSTRQALCWVVLWVLCALCFNGLLWWYLLQTQNSVIANQKALEFFTGYVIEQTLSVDNMFVFIMIFSYFAVPAEYQRRVLLYGVLSAVILRLLVILGGTWLVREFHWILYLFGFFLVLTGIKMLFPDEAKKDFSHNPILRWVRQHFRVTDNFHEEKFFVKQTHLWHMTPLFLVLIFIEISDLIFAMETPIGDDEDSHLGDFIEDVNIESPLDAATNTGLSEATQKILNSLTPREAKVLRMRFGINMNTDHTLEEVGKQFDVTRERIRQIEAKALRKLRHPSRSEQLRSFLEEQE